MSNVKEKDERIVTVEEFKRKYLPSLTEKPRKNIGIILAEESLDEFRRSHSSDRGSTKDE